MTQSVLVLHPCPKLVDLHTLLRQLLEAQSADEDKTGHQRLYSPTLSAPHALPVVQAAPGPPMLQVPVQLPDRHWEPLLQFCPASCRQVNWKQLIETTEKLISCGLRDRRKGLSPASRIAVVAVETRSPACGLACPLSLAIVDVLVAAVAGTAVVASATL